MTTKEKFIELARSCPSKTLMITGRGKLRMVSSDKKFHWNLKSPNLKRRARAEKVKEHMDWIKALQYLAIQQKLVLMDTVCVEFHMPIPASYTKKQKRELPGTPHDKKPDTDNMLKNVVDGLVKEDSHIWLKFAWKVWTDGPGKIVFYDLNTYL